MINNTINLQCDCPNDLLKLFNDINKFKPLYKLENFEEYRLPHFYKLCQKKAHEISKLAPFIKKICDQDDIKNVVDVGSGLVSVAYFKLLQ